MKRYIIHKFEKYGIYECIEEAQESGEVWLTGKFPNIETTFQFIKKEKDILL